MLDLASQMESSEFEVTVMTIGEEQAMLPQFESAGVKVVLLKMKKNPPMMASLARRTPLCQAYRDSPWPANNLHRE